MLGKINNDKATVSWDLNYEKLVSPDGTKQFLPCERCGQPEWKALNVVSYLCSLCMLFRYKERRGLL
jgi:hypothetical protein